MRRKDYTVEICTETIDGCLAAQRGGADRIELCSALAEGGITPSMATIALARMNLDIRLHVLIRPRGGDFTYSHMEAETMLSDIATLRKLQVDGVVVGCLTDEGDIDLPLLDQIIEAADGLPITFHRAFDLCRQPLLAMSQLRQRGVSRILTSGQQPTAYEGIPLLRELVTQADGAISIMPGCGINEGNIAEIARFTGAHELHLSAREPIPSAMAGSQVLMGSADSYTRLATSERRVRQAIEALCAHTESHYN